MRYLCLIYEDEKWWDKATQTDMQKGMADARAKYEADLAKLTTDSKAGWWGAVEVEANATQTQIALKTRDECVLAVQSGRADCVIMAVNLGLTAIKKNPSLGEFQMLHQPRIQLPTCMGVRKEANKDWRDFLNAWVDYNRGIQQIREWLYGGLAINGVKPEDIPPDVEL